MPYQEFVLKGILPQPGVFVKKTIRRVQSLLDKLWTACARFDHVDSRAKGSPLSNRSVPEESNGGRPEHGSQMRDPTVMPHEEQSRLKKEGKSTPIRGENRLHVLLSGKQRDKLFLGGP